MISKEVKKMRKRNQYVHTCIEDIIEHKDDVRSFILVDPFSNSYAGQFAMVWLPGVNEKPISFSAPHMITVRKVGPWSEKLFEKKKGQYLDIRGPYGNGFPLIGSSTLIGGGCGIPPLFYMFANSKIRGLSFVLAGKTKEELLFLDRIVRKAEESKHYPGGKVIAVTDDGSYGEKGVAAEADIPRSHGNYLLCGPEIMMKTVAERLVNKGVRSSDGEGEKWEKIDASRIYLSMERYMKCGVGICGNCSFSGERVCADGPVFRYDQISSLPHFNEFGRSRTGEIVDLEKLRK